MSWHGCGSVTHYLTFMRLCLCSSPLRRKKKWKKSVGIFELGIGLRGGRLVSMLKTCVLAWQREHACTHIHAHTRTRMHARAHAYTPPTHMHTHTCLTDNLVVWNHSTSDESLKALLRHKNALSMQVIIFSDRLNC